KFRSGTKFYPLTILSLYILACRRNANRRRTVQPFRNLKLENLSNLFGCGLHKLSLAILINDIEVFPSFKPQTRTNSLSEILTTQQFLKTDQPLNRSCTTSFS